VAQVVARELHLPSADLISVKASNTFVGANTDVTGGSFGSDCCIIVSIKLFKLVWNHSMQAATLACRALLAKIEAAVGAEGTWAERVTKASQSGVDCSARYTLTTLCPFLSLLLAGMWAIQLWTDLILTTSMEQLWLRWLWRLVCTVKNCNAFLRWNWMFWPVRRLWGGLTFWQMWETPSAQWCSDTNVDKLISHIVDQVDLGQVEGAFVMGLGLWLTEEIQYNPTTGRMLNFDSWVHTWNSITQC